MRPKPNIVWLESSKQALYSGIMETRIYVVFTTLIQLICSSPRKSVLDYGGGDGRFLEMLREHFDGELLYYDPSSELNSRARLRLKGSGVIFCESPQSLKRESIDVITSVAVWMTIGNNEGRVKYLRNMHRVLRNGGRAFVAVTHPCFSEEKYSSFETKFSNDRYLENGVPFAVKIHDKTTEVNFRDHHWNLSSMLDQATSVGFRLVQLKELPDIKGGNRRGAPWLCFEFGKE
jgi:ubiquinone/menaquinone biosynthesis C-methylase UbiE